MARSLKITYVIYKYGNYVSEGTKEELSRITGLRPKYINELSYPGKNLKKWQVYKTATKESLFVGRDDVDYDKIQDMIKRFEYKAKDLSEVLGVCTMTVYGKLRRKNRFRYSEIEALGDLFFLDASELLRGVKK